VSQVPPDLSRLSSVEKRALLAKLLQQKTSGVSPSSPVERQHTSLLDQFAIPVTELSTEAVLDPAIRPEGLPIEYPTQPAHIFLTGARKADGGSTATLRHMCVATTLIDHASPPLLAICLNHSLVCHQRSLISSQPRSTRSTITVLRSTGSIRIAN
jgi:hypothetical protein